MTIAAIGVAVAALVLVALVVGRFDSSGAGRVDPNADSTGAEAAAGSNAALIVVVLLFVGWVATGAVMVARARRRRAVTRPTPEPGSR